MKKMLMLIIACTHMHICFATQLIQGDVTPTTAEDGCPTNVTTSFKHPVNAKAYDRANGIFYVGLTDEGTFEANTFAVSSFKRTVGSNQIPRFQPRATNLSLTNKHIKFLAMATADGDTCSLLAGSFTTAFEDDPKTVFVLDLQNNVKESDDLKVFNPTINEDGQDANRIVGLEANQCFIFAAVVPDEDDCFGADNSGIAVVSIDRETLCLNQTAAVPGDNGIKAQQLDNTSPFIRIGNPNRFPVIVGDKAILLWDDQLNRLYIGVSLQACTDIVEQTCSDQIVTVSCDDPQEIGDGIRSIVLGKVTCCPEKGELPLFDFAPAGAFDSDQDNIVGVTLAMDGQDLSLTVSHLAMMHASTGPSYLIVHGGNGKGTNMIFALPVVDTCDLDDDDQGKLANKNQFDATIHRFTQPAVNNADLTESSDVFAQVGAGPLPIQPQQTISDIMVVGDAVYISLQIPQDDNNETGILYSQAQFDNVGRIKSWTPWTKRVWPICGFPDSPSNSQVKFFAVDAVTGKVIAVDGSPSKTVRITEWDEGGICDPCCKNCSLAAVLNRSLCDGAYSVLDLDQSTTGIGESIPFRYALFGGTNKVDFALTSSSRSTSKPFDINPVTDIPYPQRVILNYCCDEFFRETCLPEGAGCANVLEYARQRENQGNQNYFFAGTDNGLFAFAKKDGSGFNVTELGLLNEGFFIEGVWHRVPNIEGAVVDIKTSGNTLYVITFNTSCEKPFESKLLSIDFEDTLAVMFDPSNIFTIATSGTAPVLQNTLMFTAVEIIITDPDGLTEQVALTTNNGIFQSKTPGGVQGAINQTEAEWTLIQGCVSLFYGIGAIDNARIMSTVWPFSAKDCGCATFECSCIHQLNGACEDAPDFKFVPPFFNHLITCDSCACNSLCDQLQLCCPTTSQCDTPCDKISTACSKGCNNDCCCEPVKFFEKICYFWSDGGRRFFIIAPTNGKIACIPCCGKKNCCCCPFQQLRFLEVTPFNLCVWNVCDPIQTVLKDCVLRTISAFYWVRPIGMTGIILAGTPCGVVALE